MEETWIVVFDSSVPEKIIEHEIELVKCGVASDTLSEMIDDDDLFDFVVDEEMEYLNEWIPDKMKMAYRNARLIGGKLVYALTLGDGFLDKALIAMPNTEHIKWFPCRRQKVFLTSESE